MAEQLKRGQLVTSFISEPDKKKILRSLFIYIGVTLFVALFGFVYELFGHGVHSLAMEFAFLYPLGFGVIIYGLLYAFPIKMCPGFLVQNIYNFGIAMLTCGSIFQGVIEIYGTTNTFFSYTYYIVGALATSAALVLYIIGIIINIGRNKTP